MKCYIATYYKYDNYGTRLQNFALCRVLEDLQITPITLYINDNKSLENEITYLLKKAIILLPNISKRQKIFNNNLKKNNAFIDFNKSLNIVKIDFQELDYLDFNEAFAMAGSDQIWSPLHLENNPQDVKLFFLQFAPNRKRFAYAPSLGVNSITEKQARVFRNNLNDFSKLSIRENAGKKILDDLVNDNIQIVPDPVFLLTIAEWRKKLYFKANQKVDKYILTYFLGSPDKETQNNINRFSKKKNLKIINIAGNYFNKGDLVPSPDEFVYLIDNATVVFTDSFHACAFSIIMQTPFFVYRRNDVKQFSRIETLLKKFKCEKCNISNKSFDQTINHQIIYGSEILDEIKTVKLTGITYLKSILKCLEED